jgi:hypothetical protein
MLYILSRLSDQQAISAMKRRIHAHLYELRLFVDEPALVWKAQIALLRDNLRYVALMLVPAIVLTIPLIPLFYALDGFYGSPPLRPGVSTVLTVQLKRDLPQDHSVVRLDAPAGVLVESPPVRVFAADQISWRIRPLQPLTADLRIAVGHEEAEKSIVAGTGPRYVSSRRVSSVPELLRHPGESQLRTEWIEWIEVDVPDAEIKLLGLRLHWIVWLLIISMITGLALRRRFHVTF